MNAVNLLNSLATKPVTLNNDQTWRLFSCLSEIYAAG
jgi:hypothetical protein